ncbi:unnamed protein product [Cladocopium goreaui]|uniref:Uncharacterized protein n=1 Tax=Cladocopium goreaui TaxID=2562237 RepID=A0A9P1D687_9DINO|nr:unnamed protein product [Cladocopium goreaui]
MMGCLWTMLLMLEQIGCPLPERRALWGRRRPAMQMRRECMSSIIPLTSTSLQIRWRIGPNCTCRS